MVSSSISKLHAWKKRVLQQWSWLKNQRNQPKCLRQRAWKNPSILETSHGDLIRRSNLQICPFSNLTIPTALSKALKCRGKVGCDVHTLGASSSLCLWEWRWLDFRLSNMTISYFQMPLKDVFYLGAEILQGHSCMNQMHAGWKLFEIDLAAPCALH